MENVRIRLFKDNSRYKGDLFVSVNGVNYKIRRGVEVEVPPEVAEELLACTAKENINYETFVGGNAYTDRKMYDDPMAYGCTEYGAKYLRSTRKPVPDIREFILEHCTELDSIELVTHDKAERDRLWKVLEQRFPDLYITSSFFHLLELSSPSSGKSNALSWVLEQLGLTPEEIARYIATGEPMDKAGAYGIQGRGALFVEHLDGDYFNVMGLPLCRLGQLLNELGVELL